MDRSNIRKVSLYFAAILMMTLTQQTVFAQIQAFETLTQNIRAVPIAEGLSSPWSLTFLPDGNILVIEHSGQLRLIRDGQLVNEVISGTPAVSPAGTARIHGGLMDVAIHPDFTSNQLVYISYSKYSEQGSTTAVVRARLDGMQLVDAEDVFVADAWSTGDLNFGSRIIFDNNGMMFISIGDRGPSGEPLAQDLSKHNGKIVRLYDDGRIPEDNPFIGVENAKPEIYSYGHRNPQGMMMHPQTGEIWASEHGPMGGDEVNILLPGGNYGWPEISYGKSYSGDIITDQPWRENMEPPTFYWVPSIGISGLTLYTGDAFPEWKNQLIVTGMSGMLIQRVRLEGRGSRERESILTELRHEIRDVRQGPDGLLYVLARQDAARNENSGKLWRIEPAD